MTRVHVKQTPESPPSSRNSQGQHVSQNVQTFPTSNPTRRRKRRRIGDPLSRSRYVITSVMAFAVLLAAWGLVTAMGLTSPMFLPSPGAVIDRLILQIRNGELFADLTISAYRIFTAFLLATVMAIPLGILMGTSKYVEASTQPFIDFVRYMPVVAFVPLSILWVGTGEEQKFLIIWMGTFFQQVLMFADAVRQTPRSLIDVGETLGLSNRKILTRIVLRSSAPQIWNTLRISLGWAWTWLVVAELVAATSGLGFRIVLAQRYLQTDTIFAYVIVLGLLGLISDQLMRTAGRIMFSHERIRS